MPLDKNQFNKLCMEILSFAYVNRGRFIIDAERLLQAIQWTNIEDIDDTIYFLKENGYSKNAGTDIRNMIIITQRGVDAVLSNQVDFLLDNVKKDMLHLMEMVEDSKNKSNSRYSAPVEENILPKLERIQSHVVNSTFAGWKEEFIRASCADNLEGLLKENPLSIPRVNRVLHILRNIYEHDQDMVSLLKQVIK